ncbi:histidyl-tRNA synthetase [Bartonella bacilliformis str. Heidi Mejia]|uniref:Histidine--tRNA ligase n=2 Tax=Bartonella bacilliformis TaxID=774 RepID=SYH_BARBK|nr:histidine--tRNA ligase [Bartonella bacilliformis]A1UTY3.1 RecName: Full=Histidine--tRNA ligase; AltName: Full=Histidyl-tRNA synthetase; Short=HisRS [Bartonella bacilliformis KC583]ABM45003.1 histidyl-tRNA synthetase [Bartonella bacilliformis KC583]AMG86175.1 histidine--tRNA ligase [Bartonella bacilliformis]EKS43072.1 histidyl-tRNA ligase [Bartonella bacilliformis INS]EYS88588.1 histidyl-tRNA synthetase [Bartonella bacilliformis San Pedro600-02]EYS91011.1 histidyl-tRNA synthetase [Bartonell
MSKKEEKTKVRLPRGFVDRTSAQLHALETMIAQIHEVYESYGFEALETPIFEYTDVLGKFLPDSDRPNAGVFSLQDEDEQWMSLRYDLTAPLARYFAENFEILPKPYRSYRSGFVFRNEKPGPGRFRQFMQLDADIVGSSTVAADAEICMMAADSLERLGIQRHDYVIRLSNRKILDGVLELIGLQGDEQAEKRLTILRAIDKFDKFGMEGVRLLLGKGRLDESGDFTKGAGLSQQESEPILSLISVGAETAEATLDNLKNIVGHTIRGLEGIHELEEMQTIFSKNGYQDRIKIDPSVVRGLDYYTGPVFEAELLFDVLNEEGQKVVFGSVGGGGRYDGLVARFRDEAVPATGFSVGVSRLMAALHNLGKCPVKKTVGPVVVLMMDKDPEYVAYYQKMVMQLRHAGIRSELYLGAAGIKAQMKYADRRHAPCVVIQGASERQEGKVQIKDLIEGARLSAEIKDNQTWRESRPAQIMVDENQLVQAVQEILVAHQFL